MELGGGRRRVEDAIDPAAGFVIPVKPGDPVKEGEPLASVFAGDRQGVEQAMRALAEAIVIGRSGTLGPLITHRISARGMEVL